MQKKITQPIRKVMTPASTVQHHQPQQQQQQHSTMQMNAVRKIHSLLQSGTVSVTGMPGTPQRVVQKKPIVQSSSVSITTSNNTAAKPTKCYVCGETAISPVLLTEASTATSQTEFTAKIAKMVGGGYTVIVGTEDVVCRRCFSLFNQADKMESDLAVIRTTLTSYINKKYNISEDDGGHMPPAAKMQKVTSIGGAGGTAGSVTYGIKAHNDSESSEAPVLRKVVNVSSASSELQSATDVEAQLSNMFEKPMVGVASQSTVMATNNGANIITTTTSPTTATTAVRRNAIKMYKCMSCDFKTPDLTDFTPHYDLCKQNQQPQASTNANTTTAAAATPSSPMYRCKLCGKIFQTVALLKQHSNLEHQGPNAQQQQQQGQTDGKSAQTGAPGQLISCNMCTYKTMDKQYYDDHLRKHIKLKPFKCRVCLQRFETREQASIHAKNHQPDYFKCGICNVTFNKRDLLMKHLETHELTKKQPAVPKPVLSQTIQQPIPHVPIKMEGALSNADSSTQKLLQDSIDEALSGTVADAIDGKPIQFHSCGTCSLTFLNQSMYSQHMRMHTNGNGAGGALLNTSTANPVVSMTVNQQLGSNAIINRKTTAHNMTLGNSLSNTINSADLNLAGKIVTSSAGAGNQINMADGDLESIFEKIHSDKGDTGTLVTGQDGSGGNITFNITLGQQGQDGTFVQQQLKPDDVKLDLQQAQPSIGIDMPTLDQGDDQEQQKQQQAKQQQDAMGMSVSMPSLDDDGEQSQNSQNSNTDNVPMELEDMQGVDGQQIKFIVNENGQLLQFTENSQFLTTDADGNQIIVQGADSEQFQQLLQSVGVVMQSGDGLGEGETLQMISGGEGNNQMILVQGADGQEQLIDASLLNADGNIVIQQSQDGELNAEGTHITTEDGLQIPVSVAFTTSGEMDQEGNLTVAMAGGEGAEQQIQLHLQHQGDGDEDDQQHIETGGEQQAILTEGGHIILQAQDQSQQHQEQQEQQQQQIEHQQQQQQQQAATEETAADAAVANEDDGDDDACKANGGGIITSDAMPSTENGSNISTTGTTIDGTAVSATSDAPAAIEAASAAAGTTTAGDEQGMFNFDELIQPQVVVKPQHQQ